MANLIIPVGLPGCGKSTWAKNLLSLKYAIVSSDEIRKNLFESLRSAHDVTPEERHERNTQVFDLFHRKIDDCLRMDVDVFADATNLNPFARKNLVEIARKNHCQTHLLFFKNPEQAFMRNVRRDRDAVVPKDVMDNFYVKYLECLRDIKEEEYDSVTEIGGVG